MEKAYVDWFTPIKIVIRVDDVNLDFLFIFRLRNEEKYYLPSYKRVNIATEGIAYANQAEMLAYDILSGGGLTKDFPEYSSIQEIIEFVTSNQEN